jgi:hypothetical protein
MTRNVHRIINIVKNNYVINWRLTPPLPFSVPLSLDTDDLGTKVYNWIRSGKQESET